MAVEVTTVADDEAVLFDGEDWTRFEGLDPDTEYSEMGETFRTLPRPPGERLATVATVNDIHFGEIECGVLEGLDVGPVLRAEPGEPPYADVMNMAAITEIAAISPDAVVAKGDLTTHGSLEEYQAFLDAYGSAFGARLHQVRGNHDGYFGETFASEAPFSVDLPGVTLAVLDTVIPRSATGQVPSSTSSSSTILARVIDCRTPESSDGVRSEPCGETQKMVEVGASSTTPSGVTSSASSAPRPWAILVACMLAAYESDLTPVRMTLGE